jgi:hypothetical protein
MFRNAVLQDATSRVAVVGKLFLRKAVRRQVLLRPAAPRTLAADLSVRQADDVRRLIKAARSQGGSVGTPEPGRLYDDIVAAMQDKYPGWRPDEERLRARIASIVVAVR